MAGFIDDFIRNNMLDPIGKAYTDGADAFRQDTPSADVQKSVGNIVDTFGNREEAIGWELNVLGDDEKYNKYGMTRNKQTLEAYNKGTLDKQFAELQSGREKLWNGVKQALWSETVLGTLGSLGTLYDIVSGNIFKADNNYQNEWSNYFEKLQEDYRESNKIYVDPDKQHDLSSAGWWASNMPSIMSSFTLLIPSTGITKGLKLLAKGAKLDKFARGSVRAITQANKFKTAEEAAQGLNKFQRWANAPATIESTNRMLELGTNALFSRTLENYQESRQVYNDMYNDAAEAFGKMDDAAFADYLDRHEYIKNHFAASDGELPRRDDVAKFIAKQSADETFIDDYTNIMFDVAQLYALKNPLKLMKNMRTTTAVSRAERLARRYPGKTMKEIEALEAKRTYGRKALDWASDRYKNAAIIGAELSEGVEEGINYIAQQEGMHFGNVLLDKDTNTTFSDRFIQSYVNAPELYESAFWGVLGGVVFQGLGSGFNNLQRGIAKKIDKTINKEDEKTKEKVNKESWQDDFENPETKRRVASIEARNKDFQDLSNKLAVIKSGKDPYHLNNDGVTQKELTSEVEADAARNRAIDEYITSMTLREMDNGNYDMLKAYFKDAKVQQALIDAGIVDSEDIQNFVDVTTAKMDDIERRYNDNIIALNNVAASMEEPVPIEYLQIIARDNVAAQMDIDDIQRRIEGYEVSAQNNERRYGIDEEQAMNFKAASQLIVSARRLAMLNAEQKQIEKDKDTRESLAGQIRLDEIEKEKEAINDYLYNSNDSYSDNITKLLWATAIGLQGTYDETGKFTLSNTDDYLDFLEKIARKEKKYEIDRNHTFELSDEKIISLFGEDGTSGSYGVLAQQLDADFEVLENIDKKAKNNQQKLSKEAKALDDDYQAIAALTLNKYIRQSKISTKTSEVSSRINELHNVMNAARIKAIADSHKIIYDAARKYGYENVRNYIFNNDELNIEDANEKETAKRNIDDAVSVLNLSSGPNRQLAEDLNNSLILGELRKNIDERPQETNLGNQNLSESTQTTQTEESSQNPLGMPTEAGNAEIQPTEQQQPLPTQPNQKKISLAIDGGVVTEDVTNENADNTSFEYTSNPDGTFTLLADKKDNIATKLLESSELFEGYDRNNTAPMRVVKNPVLYSEEGETIVTEKGIIEYNQPTEETATTATTEATGGTSSISSTGELTTQEETPGVAIPDDQVLEYDDEELTQYTKMQSVVRNIFKNRDESIPAEQLLQQAEDVLKEQYKDSLSQPSVQNNINKVIERTRTRLENKGLLEKVDNVIERSSSVTEIKGRYDFGKDYITAVEQLLIDYANRARIPQIDDKYYINLENLLRDINTLYDDKSIANLLYNNMKEYLKTKDAKDSGFIVTDYNVDDPNFLNNVRKTAKVRSEERIGDSITLRVNIDTVFGENSNENRKDFLDAFNSIEKGDKLQVKRTAYGLALYKNGVQVGSLPNPKVNPNNGSLYMTTKGWITDVVYDSNSKHILSDLEDFFKDIIINHEDINNIIKEINYGQLNKEEKDAKVKELYEKLKALEGFTQVTNVNHKAEDIVDYITSLWSYFDTSSLDNITRNDYINYSLGLWFEKLYNSYSTINDLSDESADTLDIQVSNITSGVIRRIVPISADSQGRENKNQQYEEFNYSGEAIANIDEAGIAIVNPDQQGNLLINLGSGNVVSVEHPQTGNRGTIYTVIKNKTGNYDYVVGTSVKFRDGKAVGTAKEIIDVVKKEINTRIDNYLNNPTDDTFTNLTDFLVRSFYTSADKASSVSTLPVNTGIFYGVRVSRNNKNGTITIANGKTLISINPSNLTFGYIEDSEANRNAVLKHLNNENDKKTFKNAINTIINSSGFNISRISINNGQTEGFATVQTDGKYVINIPRTNAEPYVAEFGSFKDFVLRGSIIKVNTEINPNTGTNYDRKTDNNYGNQVLEVNVKSKKQESLPVEEISTEESAEITKSRVEEILEDDKIEDKARKIAKEVFSEETLKRLDNLQLLPKKIIFARDLNTENADKTWNGDNARAIISTGETLVGRRFIDMFNEQGEFITSKDDKGYYKLQAIRKLIHEQLHHRLNRSAKYRKNTLAKVKEIYDDFKNYLDSNNVDENDTIRQYLFTNEKEDVALEEFLVESLTSKELADYLNNIEVESKDTKIKNTLWQRILKTLSDIFGWGVKEGSLYEKELKALQKDIEEAANNAKQLELNFDATETQETETAQETSEVETIEKEDTTISLEDLDDVDIFNDGFNTRGSSVTERVNKYQSLPAVLNTMSGTEQVKFVQMLDNGSVSTRCR